MFDAKSRLDGFQKGVGTLMEGVPDSINSLFEFINATQKEGALTVREKELIAIGVSIYTRCEDCIAVHAQKALQAGCTTGGDPGSCGNGYCFRRRAFFGRDGVPVSQSIGSIRRRSSRIAPAEESFVSMLRRQLRLSEWSHPVD